MSTDELRPTDFDRLAAAWLADGPTELADRVLDDALREVHRTHQRRRLVVPWRTFTVNRYLAAAAAVVVLLVAGFAFVGRGPATTGSSPNPSPSSIPTSAPSPAGSVALKVITSNAGYTIAVPTSWNRGATVGTAGNPDLWFEATPPITSLYIWAGSQQKDGTYRITEEVSSGTVDIAGRTIAELLASDDTYFGQKGSNAHQVSIDGETAWVTEYPQGNGFDILEAVVIHGIRAYNLQLEAPTDKLAELRSAAVQLFASMRWTS